MPDLFNAHGWRITVESATLPDGRIKEVARVHRADSVHLLAFPTEETVLLLREYRPYYGHYVWMLPSGRVDKETDIVVAAQRELQEETGFRAAKLEKYFTTNHSESLIMSNHVFFARELTKDPLPQDEDELIEVHELPLEEALNRVLTCERVHSVSALALLRYLHDKQS